MKFMPQLMNSNVSVRNRILIGSGAGVLTGLFAMAAVFIGCFWLFCLPTFFGGAYVLCSSQTGHCIKRHFAFQS